MYQFTPEREARQGIGVLSTDESADATDISLPREQIRPSPLAHRQSNREATVLLSSIRRLLDVGSCEPASGSRDSKSVITAERLDLNARFAAKKIRTHKTSHATVRERLQCARVSRTPWLSPFMPYVRYHLILIFAGAAGLCTALQIHFRVELPGLRSTPVTRPDFRNGIKWEMELFMCAADCLRVRTFSEAVSFAFPRRSRVRPNLPRLPLRMPFQIANRFQ